MGFYDENAGQDLIFNKTFRLSFHQMQFSSTKKTKQKFTEKYRLLAEVLRMVRLVWAILGEG